MGDKFDMKKEKSKLEEIKGKTMEEILKEGNYGRTDIVKAVFDYYHIPFTEYQKNRSMKDFAINRDASSFAVAEFTSPNNHDTIEFLHNKWVDYFKKVYN